MPSAAPPLPHLGPPQPGLLTCQRALSSLLSRLHCIWITWGWQGPKVTHKGSHSATEEWMHPKGAPKGQ